MGLESNIEGRSALRRIAQAFPLWKFILGALMPLALYYALHRLGHGLEGALLALGWVMVVIGLTYWRTRQIDLFIVLVGLLTLVALVVVLLTRDERMYLASAPAQDLLFALLLLGSLACGQPLLGRLARELGLYEVREGERRSSDDRLIHLLTAVWGLIFLIKGAALLAVLFAHLVPLEAFLVLVTFLGWPFIVVLVILSLWFARRSWGWMLPEG